LGTPLILSTYVYLLFHLRSRLEFPENTALDFISNGARGVDFFFVLSGFVIHHVSRSAVAEGRFQGARFMWRRFSRIYPLHAAVLFGFIGLALVGSLASGAPVTGLSVDNVVTAFTLTQAFNLSNDPALNSPAWTLSAEMFAYAVFALLALGLGPRFGFTAAVFLCVASFVGAHFAAIALGKTEFIHLTSDFGILRILPTFFLGVVLSHLAPQMPRWTFPVLTLAGAILLVVIASRPDAGYRIIGAFALLVLGGAGLPATQYNPLSWRPFIYLGEISYGIYLTHILVFNVWLYQAAPRLLPSFDEYGLLITGGSTVAVVLAVSAAGYHIVEHPFRTRLNASFDARFRGARGVSGPA
jgi:peptidoglycan/LPS O-acetylase OafA/YrhL